MANPASDTAREFRDLVRSILEDAAKPNLSHFFPVLKMLDLQGIRRRIKVHFGKLFQLFDRLIDQRLKQRQEHGYTKSKDVLILFLIFVKTSVEIDRNNIKYLIAVYIYIYSLFGSLSCTNYKLRLLESLAIFTELTVVTDRMITGFVCCGSRYNVRYTVMGNGGTTLQSRGFIESPIRDGTNNWQR